MENKDTIVIDKKNIKKGFGNYIKNRGSSTTFFIWFAVMILYGMQYTYDMFAIIFTSIVGFGIFFIIYAIEDIKIKITPDEKKNIKNHDNDVIIIGNNDKIQIPPQDKNLEKEEEEDDY